MIGSQFREDLEMIRRRFLQLLTIGGTGALGAIRTVASSPSRRAIYRVKGFTCVTCATGLDTLLGRQKGVLSSKSTYPEGTVKVDFNPEATSDDAIVDFITELGFTVVREEIR
jgi:copper chaperone CopZ